MQDCGDKVRFEPSPLWNPPIGITAAVAGRFCVVDPGTFHHLHLETDFRAGGIRVWAATDYSAAEKMMLQNDYDAVLADVHLEDRRGMGLLRRAMNRQRPPVVMLSTDEPDVESLRTMMKMKVNYLFFKPIDLTELRSTLACMITRRASSLAAST